MNTWHAYVLGRDGVGVKEQPQKRPPKSTLWAPEDRQPHGAETASNTAVERETRSKHGRGILATARWDACTEKVKHFSITASEIAGATESKRSIRRAEMG